MARAISVFRHTPYSSHTPRPAGVLDDAPEDLADLIEDTIRMIENTRSFLTRLDHSQSASREEMARSRRRLDQALTSLKRRQRGLTDCEY